MSLRARLLTVLVSLAAVGLLVAAIVTYASLRSFLIDRVDHTVTGSAEAIARSLERGRPGGGFETLGAANPGIYIGSAAGGRVAWAPIATRPGATPLPQPDLSANRATGEAVGGDPFTVSAVSGKTRFRVQLESLGTNQVLIVAVPLNEVDDTLHQLLIVELVVALSVLVAILLAGLWLVRVGLPASRPDRADGGGNRRW